LGLVHRSVGAIGQSRHVSCLPVMFREPAEGL